MVSVAPQNALRHSCMYEGTVMHRRQTPKVHAFRYRLFMLYFDLGELDALVGSNGLISQRRWASRSLLREDHLFREDCSIDLEARRMVEAQTGRMPSGPIRMLTQLRYCGHYLSPLNLYYVFDEAGRNVEQVIAEVNNTPWAERHCYVLWEGNRYADRGLQFKHAKQFHVSPFMQMDLHYQWRLTCPGDTLRVHLANVQNENDRIFDASMNLRRQPLSDASLRSLSRRYCIMTARIGAAIYFQALKLWWKRCPLYSHPKHLSDIQPRTANITS